MERISSSSRPSLDLLANIFAGYPAISAVYLFGSLAEGNPHLESDLDLAIVPVDASLRDKKLDILADLVRHGFEHVDLVFLDTDDILLKFEAVRHNRPIYLAENFDHSSYFSRVLNMYFDFEPYLHVHREAQKRRILHG